MTERPAKPDPDDLHCTEEVEMITDYLEGALPEAERGRFERHLATCPGCVEYVEQMRAIAGSLGELREDQLPDEMRRGLLDSFRELRHD
jgi:anti-sigma factor RsiW